MLAEKAIICADCAKSIAGEYIVQKKNGQEEYYHPECAKRKGALKLPVQIRFTQGHYNDPKNDSISRPNSDSRLNQNNA